MRTYASSTKALLTLAAAARELEISRQTLLKWESLGYIHFTTIGPPQAPIRRVPEDKSAEMEADAQKPSPPEAT